MNKTKPPQVLCVAALVVLLVAASKLAPQALELKKPEDLNFVSLLGTLFIIALLAERTLEVLLTTFRGPEADSQDRGIKAQTDAIAALEAAAPPDKNAVEKANQHLRDLSEKRESYRMTTRSIALWAGLFAGVLVSAIGIRVLQQLVADPPCDGSRAATLFTVADVLLTGCLIAGGSDGIHKMSELYNSTINAGTKSANARAEKANTP